MGEMMVQMMKIKLLGKITACVGLMFLLVACEPEVGSDKWCNKIENKSKEDITLSEAKDYAKHCILRTKK